MVLTNLSNKFCIDYIIGLIESAWAIDYIDGEYVNISIYSPLSRITYIKLPDKLKNLVKSLINIKNIDNKCFLWYHVRL